MNIGCVKDIRRMNEGWTKDEAPTSEPNGSEAADSGLVPLRLGMYEG
jgi:hypothetical protein